ncbi:MAG: tellurite resistance/C4-dicarboxylate transporter family protein [Proteobacteria bacterium]|nr:tellurite resistance/C4-dicarboxylate transporter family protein [Pseudomonadota bacterium]
MTHKQPHWLKDLYPGYFAMTMATGIISVALRLQNHLTLADIFFVTTLLTWVILVTLYTWRLLRFPQAVLENLTNPRTTFMFFTFVAATAIVGILLRQHGYVSLAIVCWFVAFIYWSALMYFGFASLIFAHKKREVNVVHGGWLILIVGTQSLVLLGTKISSDLGEYAAYMMVEIHMLWSLGMIFYAIFVTIFCYRIFFFNMEVKDYSPLMWVIMGAAAISANAGSSLLLTDPVIPLLVELRPSVQMISIMLWTWATWWIPLLVMIGLWKHYYMKVPLQYEATMWSIIFPLGMYTVATNNLALAAEFTPLLYLSKAMLYIAVASWLLLMLFLLKSFLSKTREVKKL